MNGVQPTSGQGSSTEKSELTGHLDSIARAIFIIWTGTAMLVAMPWGWFLVGLGSLILSATSNVDASLSFAVVVLLSVLGLILYGLAVLVRRRVLRWQ